MGAVAKMGVVSAKMGVVNEKVGVVSSKNFLRLLDYLVITMLIYKHCFSTDLCTKGCFTVHIQYRYITLLKLTPHHLHYMAINSKA